MRDYRIKVEFADGTARTEIFRVVDKKAAASAARHVIVKPFRVYTYAKRIGIDEV